MALLKADVKSTHPYIVGAARDVQREVNRVADPAKYHFGEMYTPAIMLLFLLELDPARYRAEIEKLWAYMKSSQRSYGGWGYPADDEKHSGTADTSMTQYAVLALWELNKAGFNVPVETIERVLIWLLKVQDPSGGFGYQGRVSNTFTPIEQDEIRHSRTAAALGSVYICAHLLKLVDSLEEEPEDDGVPDALRKVENRQRERPRTSVNPTLVRTVMGRGNQWFEANYTVKPPHWKHYYWERYWSFREAAEGKRKDRRDWYTDGARHLLQTQLPTGAWQGQLGEWTVGQQVATAFAIMFLTRAARKTVGPARDLGDGLLIGGRDFPKDSGSVTIKDGQVVSQMAISKLEAMLDNVDEMGEENIDAIEGLAVSSARDAKPVISKHEALLRQLAADESARARLAAVRALAAARNFDNVPTFIYALTDPEPAVVRAARDGLRRASSKFRGFGLPDDPTPQQVDAAIEKWKSWLQSVRPDAEFDD
jgi:hypothetical protein